MAEFLRSAIASPRARYYDPVADTYLDLAYLDKNIIVCSMPTSEFPAIMYRNSLSDLRKLLSLRHGNHWHVWEFRSEGTGYEDSELFNRVSHFPFPDHNPPPFILIPQVISSIHQYLSQNEENVAVLHCKAGKGRSGTMFCAYMIAQRRWSSQRALAHFTSKRMKAGFGEGVSILSQRRYIKYVEQWARDPNREYCEIPVIITEVRILNPVNGLEIKLAGFAGNGDRIETAYEFTSADHVGQRELTNPDSGTEIILRPSTDVYISSDVRFQVEKKIHGPAGLFFLSSESSAWFNIFFESRRDEPTGTFTVPWEQTDGFKGTRKRGGKTFDSISIDWLAYENMSFPFGSGQSNEFSLAATS
ncbi:putative phosphoinositide 3-phosphate phosphatase protein [Lipomyces oligophaga]|uniref:putative phosphoinositide 3-phosphate phosphatase protein n=1 Tax=Lipomyces oligophaga TaxID=45792 RepID=UPI0034CF695B